MKKYLLVLLCICVFSGKAQESNWTRLIINPQLKIDTSFNKKWSYPWYMIKHPDGHFENTITDTITEEDTTRQYYTAACNNSQNGNHQIDYCKAYTYNDDVELHFSGTPPGYNEDMVVVIRKGYFRGQYNLASMVLEPSINSRYQIVSQRLVLKSRPVYDSVVTGTIEIRFRKKIKQLQHKNAKKSSPNSAVTYSEIYTLKGRFHTILNSDISIE